MTIGEDKNGDEDGDEDEDENRDVDVDSDADADSASDAEEDDDDDASVDSDADLEDFISTPLPEDPILDFPETDDLVTSPLTITGQAPGLMFFEGSFSFRITDEEGNLIVKHYVMAEDSHEMDYEGMRQFSGTVEFDAGDTERGYLILERECPSGLCTQEEIDVLKVGVKFTGNSDTE